MSTSLRLSADGLFYWDGAQWVSTLSPDGHQRWDGTRWVPLQSVAVPVTAGLVAPPPPRPRTVRTPTSWTRPLQWAIAGWYALQCAWAISLAALLALNLNDFANSFVVAEERAHPQDLLPPPGYATDLALTAAFYLFAVVAPVVGVSVVVIVTALRRSTWGCYVAMAALVVSAFAVPLTLLALFLPLWIVLSSAAVSAALLVWMLVAVLRRGPWAMTRSPSGGQ